MLHRCLRWGLAGALVAWTVTRVLGLERGWPFVPLFAFTPYVALLALVVAALAAWRRWKAGALLIGACAALLLALMAPRAIPDRAPTGAPGVRVRVLAANIAGNEDVAPQMLAALRRWHVDVFSAVELSPRAVVGYDLMGAGERFRYRALRPEPGFMGTGLYSRFPLHTRRPPATAFDLAAAELRAPGAAPVELTAVHVPAPTTAHAAPRWRHDMRTLPSAGTGSLRVLAGDFNATLDHAELRRLLDRGYRDAAEQAGVALSATWPAGKLLLPPLIAIDHVLADRRIRVLSVRTVAIPGSDHRGVLADLLLPRG